MSELTNKIEALNGDRRWFNPGGINDAQLVEMETQLGRSIPSSVGTLYKAAFAAEWAGQRIVAIFDNIAILDVNPELHEQWLEGAFAFASDSGPSWYIVDGANKLGRGSEAVWELPAGAPFAEEARFVAESVEAFVDWMTNEDADA